MWEPTVPDAGEDGRKADNSKVERKAREQGARGVRGLTPGSTGTLPNPTTEKEAAIMAANKNTAPASTATTTEADKAPKPTYREVTGTVKAPATLFRRIRQEKGYGRVAMAAALGITTSAWWKVENHTDPNSTEGKAMLAKVQALPSLKAVAPTADAKGKAPAKASKSDLI